MITKYATVEKILDVKSSRYRLEPGDLGSSLFRFAALNNGLRKEDDYLYVRCRAISSRVNKNNDGWPSEELSNAYKTFLGRPTFVDHHNDDPRRTRGVVVDAALHRDEDEKTSALDPYYSTAPDNHKPPTWIELLIEIDAKTFPKLAKAIESGDMDAVSMGANIERSICSVCANEATTSDEYCSHVKQKGLTFEITSDNGEKIRKKAYEDCYGVNFFELSHVFDPADETADSGLAFKAASNGKKIYTTDEVKAMAAKIGGNGRVTHELAYHLASKGQFKLGDEFDELQQLNTDEPTCPDCGSHDIRPSEMYDRSIWECYGCGKQGYYEEFESPRHTSVKTSDLPEESLIAPVNQKSESDDNRNYIPQADKITAPQQVDTLRNDNRCPVCQAGEMENDPDGIQKCPVCGHVAEPEPLNNPDLDAAKQEDALQREDPQSNPVGDTMNQDPLDSIEFSQAPAMATSKTIVPRRGIIEMFTTKLRTKSRKKVDALLPAKTGRTETKFANGVHRGIYKAAADAGLKVRVSYPAIDREESTLDIPGSNGIFNLFFAEESAQKLKVPMNEVPIVVEADSQETVDAFVKLLTETPRPSKTRQAAENKQPILPAESKPTDEPAKETVVNDALTPTESKAVVVTDDTVEMDGKKYRLVSVEEEKDDELEVTDADVDDDTDDKDDDAKEAKLLAAFTLADLSVEVGLVDQEHKMTYISDLENETLESITAKLAMLKTMKTAGFNKSANRSSLSLKRVPRLAHATRSENSTVNGLAGDVPDEAIFM